MLRTISEVFGTPRDQISDQQISAGLAMLSRAFGAPLQLVQAGAVEIRLRALLRQGPVTGDETSAAFVDTYLALLRQSEGSPTDIPASRATRKTGRPRVKDQKLEALKVRVRKLRESRMPTRGICQQLDSDKKNRPPRVAWRSLRWVDAYRNPNYKNAVEVWISRA